MNRQRKCTHEKWSIDKRNRLVSHFFLILRKSIDACPKNSSISQLVLLLMFAALYPSCALLIYFVASSVYIYIYKVRNWWQYNETIDRSIQDFLFWFIFTLTWKRYMDVNDWVWDKEEMGWAKMIIQNISWCLSFNKKNWG